MLLGCKAGLMLYTYFTRDVTCFLQQEKLDENETAGRNEAWVCSGLVVVSSRQVVCFVKNCENFPG